MNKTSEIAVVGRKWDSSRPIFFTAPEGLTLSSIILSSIERAYRENEYSKAQYESLLKYARCRVDGVEVKREAWASYLPRSGARIEVLHGVRGGGGGGGGSKNPIATVLSVVVVAIAAVATWYVGGIGGAMVGAALFATKAAIGVAAAGALYAINALFPPSTAKPKMNGVSNSRAGLEDRSQVYSLDGGRNSANVGGYVPLVLGRHRFSGPLAGRSWTAWEGNKQYFYMCVCWGHSDVSVSDFRIGKTPLSSYRNVSHKFHQSTTGHDLVYFNKSYNEETIGTLIEHSAGWIEHAIGEAQEFSIDFAFRDGLCWIYSIDGNKYSFSVQIEVEYKKTSENNWRHLGTYTWSGSTLNLIVKTVRKSNLPRDYYTVRVRRNTADSNSSYIYDKCLLNSIRSVLYKSGFSTPVPIAVSELRILASDQLNSYIDDFNALCVSKIPDWDEASGQWVRRETSNPASIYRYLLTSRHGLNTPFSTNKIDNASLVELWRYANQHGYEFNFVADTETSLWERLVQVLAPARAAPTTDVDGKWGVVIDRNGKVPVQMFTPRNSWGMSIQRGFAHITHGLRATFVDEDNNYEQRIQYIFNDGYSAEGGVVNGKPTLPAQDVIEWDFPGITKWNKVWQQGRLYLGRALHRQMTIALNTDWEWLVCHRGDLVGVASDVLMNVFGTARILDLVFIINGKPHIVTDNANIPLDAFGKELKPIGVHLDDSIIYDEPAPARYGIGIRDNTGALTTYEITPVYGEESNYVLFAHPITTGVSPKVGDLCSVSLLGHEYDEYLVSTIAPKDDNTCELILIPYKMDEIEAGITGTIPPYQEFVILDVLKDGKKLPVPKIKKIASDESMAIVNSGGNIIFRMGIYFEIPANTISDGYQIQAKAELVNAMTEEIEAEESEDPDDKIYDSSASYAKYAYTQLPSPMVVISDVEEEKEYDVCIRIVSNSGRVGDWSPITRHRVVGRTALPPTVTGFFAKIEDSDGINLYWDKCEVFDVNQYRIYGDAKVTTPGTKTTINVEQGGETVSVDKLTTKVRVSKKFGTILFSLVAVDTGGRESAVPAQTQVEVLRPATPVLQGVEAKNDGIYITWQNCETTWPLETYSIYDTFTDKRMNALTQEFLVSYRNEGTYIVEVRAKDKFGNWSETGQLVFTVLPLEAPQTTLEIKDGVVRISWQPVTTFFPIKTYQVFSVNGQLLQETKATYYDVDGPAGIVEFRIRAVDTAGNVSAFAEVSLEITPPEAPQVKVELNRNKNGLIISWNVPDSMLPVLTYEIVRQWEETRQDGVIETKEYDYGATDSTFYDAIPILANEYTFMVRAVDASGNRSVWGYTDFNVICPSSPFITDVGVIDNNVLIYWDAPEIIFFAIDHYDFYIVEDEYEMLVGRIDARFCSRFEERAGLYQYRVYAIDVAGNRSQYSETTARISQPPNFILYNNYDSLFNGSKTYAMLNGVGGMLLPVRDETWEENARLVATELGMLDRGVVTWNNIVHYASQSTDNVTWEVMLTDTGDATSQKTWDDIAHEWPETEYGLPLWEDVTWQHKTDNGYDYYWSPSPNIQGKYVEVIDYGIEIAATNITVTVGREVLEGTPDVHCQIEVSSDNETWIEVAQDAFTAFAVFFRYVRYTITVEGGVLNITNINFRLDVSAKSDFGSVYSNATDNGDGYIDRQTTPMLYGTEVRFGTGFADVQSGPMVFCNEEGKTAYCTFVDVPYPTSFRVYVLDRDGNRVSGRVDWSAHGV